MTNWIEEAINGLDQYTRAVWHTQVLGDHINDVKMWGDELDPTLGRCMLITGNY